MIEIYIYILTFLIIFFIGVMFNKFWHRSPKTKKYYLVITFIPLFLVSGWRADNVGTDTYNYLLGFRSIRDVSPSSMFEIVRWEYGYVLLNKVSSILSNNEQIILVSTSFLVLSGVMYFIYINSENIVFSVFLYISLYLYLFSFNGIRQAIAMSILVMGFHLIMERKFFRYLIVVLMATLFHETAILMLSLYFIYYFKFNMKNVLVVSFIFVLSFISIELIISYILSFTRSLSYIDTTAIVERSGILFPLINFSIFVFMLYIKITNHIKDPILDLFLFIAILGFFGSLLSIKVYKLLRLNYYFMIYYIVSIPYSLKLIRSKRLKLIMSYLVIAISSVYLIARLTSGWHGIIPYYFGEF